MTEETKRGRPSGYSDEIAAIICQRIADGESLRAICRDDDMPAMAAVFRWLADKDRAFFREQYTRAREAQADAIVDEILEIADDGSNDWMERRNSDGENIGWSFNGEAARRSQIRIDARKWLAARMNPKKYSEKQMLEHSGPDGGPIETVTKIELVSPTDGDGQS